MLKIAIIGCLCAVVLVEAQMGEKHGPGHGMHGSMMHSMQSSHPRAARQAPMEGPPQMQGGGPGNLGMQGLGNIPDPTAVIAKAQEVGRQFISGRRRRDVETTTPEIPA